MVHKGFKRWVDDLDIGRWVPHQARHSLATNLLRAGASLTHIRRYSARSPKGWPKHYVRLSNSDLEQVLQQVWVAGPGTANPGELLTGELTPLTHEQAQALAIDLSRRSTPAEGGFCTFQPVVDGGNCPWNLNCHNCNKFVLSGPDLLYWRRKREQWRHLAEGAPDDATADYLHHTSSPPPVPSTGSRKRSLGSGCSTRLSNWTCANPRTTSTASGLPPSAPATSPPPAIQAPTTTTTMTKPAHDYHHEPLRIAHRRPGPFTRESSPKITSLGVYSRPP